MTFDTRIGGVGNLLQTDTPIKTTKTVGNTFDSIFDAALDVVKETNEYQLAASQAQTDYATGKTDDMLAVILAQEKAYSSLNFTTQITNKIIESYREIMRMQI